MDYSEKIRELGVSVARSFHAGLFVDRSAAIKNLCINLSKSPEYAATIPKSGVPLMNEESQAKASEILFLSSQRRLESQKKP